ncbi:hypothetical protein DB29_02680 [Shouchella clausii]|nr:hypothetical protein DB29_02680 [Shouchella clausii]
MEKPQTMKKRRCFVRRSKKVELPFWRCAIVSRQTPQLANRLYVGKALLENLSEAVP